MRYMLPRTALAFCAYSGAGHNLNKKTHPSWMPERVYVLHVSFETLCAGQYSSLHLVRGMICGQCQP